MLTIVPTETQFHLLSSHPEGYEVAIDLCTWQFRVWGLDVDAGFERLKRNIAQQQRFNATRAVKASRKQMYKNAEYRMLKGN